MSEAEEPTPNAPEPAADGTARFVAHAVQPVPEELRDDEHQDHGRNDGQVGVQVASLDASVSRPGEA